MLSVEDGNRLRVRKVSDKRYVTKDNKIFVAVRVKGASGDATISLRTRNLGVTRVFDNERDLPFSTVGEFTLLEFQDVENDFRFGLECVVLGPGAAFGGKLVNSKNEVEHQNLRLIFLKNPEETVEGLVSTEPGNLEEAIIAEERKLLALEILRDQDGISKKSFDARCDEIGQRLADLRSDLLNYERPREIGGSRLLSPTGKKLSLARKLIDTKKGEFAELSRSKKLGELLS